MQPLHEGVFDYLEADHNRLDGLFQQANAQSGAFDMGAYDVFRSGLLRHIAMEERILFPLLLSRGGEGQRALVERLHLDHGALAALLVPSPTPAIIATLLAILSVHNELEEKDGGAYRFLDDLPAAEMERLVQQLKATPAVPASPYNDKPGVLEATRRALTRAGYTLQNA